MKNMKQLLQNLITEESGQDLIEYALVAALVGLGSVASMSSLGELDRNHVQRRRQRPHQRSRVTGLELT